MTNVVVILTTLPDNAETDELARALVDARLAACVNLHSPMVSCYRWQGAIECERERQLVIKTTRDRVADIAAWLRTRHPYELPEFLVLPVDEGSAAYVEWVTNEST